MRWCSYTISAVGLLPWLLVLAVIWPPKAATAGGKKNNDLSGDLIPIPDHLKDQYNNRHLVDELNSGDIDYDEYIDLELEKHKSKEMSVLHCAKILILLLICIFFAHLTRIFCKLALLILCNSLYALKADLAPPSRWRGNYNGWVYPKNDTLLCTFKVSK